MEKGTAGGPRAPPGMRSSPQRLELKRQAWPAGKADEVGHHAPPRMSHRDSPWGGRKCQVHAIETGHRKQLIRGVHREVFVGL